MGTGPDTGPATGMGTAPDAAIGIGTRTGPGTGTDTSPSTGIGTGAGSRTGIGWGHGEETSWRRAGRLEAVCAAWLGQRSKRDKGSPCPSAPTMAGVRGSVKAGQPGSRDRWPVRHRVVSCGCGCRGRTMAMRYETVHREFGVGDRLGRAEELANHPDHCDYGQCVSLDYPDPELADERIRLRGWRLEDGALAREVALADPSTAAITTVPDDRA
jgi:hypothetical protein